MHFCRKNLTSRIRTFVVESTSVPGLGEGGIELNHDNASISLLIVKLIFIWVKNLTFAELATALGNQIGDQNSQSS